MRIGIYGGSFSPPHEGHVRLARRFIDAMDLDRIIIMPAGNPPHKRIDGGADAECRLEMCKAAFLHLSDRVEISDFEVFRTDPCYTVDTLRYFAGEGELFMLCGSDMFLTLGSWREPQEIFRLATVVCGTRVNDPETKGSLVMTAEKYRGSYGARTVIMDFEPAEVSSTEIRNSLTEGRRPDGICDGVFDIICRHGLYGYICKEDLDGQNLF